MIKLRAPYGVTALCHEGHSLEIASDGAVMVDDRHAPHLRDAFGFTDFDAPARVEDPRREALIEQLKAMDTDELESLLDQSKGGKDETVDVTKVTPEVIDGMKRDELFAFLKAKGIPAPTPITNEALRDKVKAAL